MTAPATIAELATGLATRLSTISGLRAVSTIPDQISPPVGVVAFSGVDYHQLGDPRLALYRFTVTVIVGRMAETRAQAALDGYLSASGTSSVRAAIEGDPTLGGICSFAVVESATAMAPLNVGEVPYLSVDFAITVHA